MYWRQIKIGEAFTLVTDAIVRVKTSREHYVFINNDGFIHQGTWTEDSFRWDLTPQGEFLVTEYTIGGKTHSPR